MMAAVFAPEIDFEGDSQYDVEKTLGGCHEEKNIGFS